MAFLWKSLNSAGTTQFQCRLLLCITILTGEVFKSQSFLEKSLFSPIYIQGLPLTSVWCLLRGQAQKHGLPTALLHQPQQESLADAFAPNTSFFIRCSCTLMHATCSQRHNPNTSNQRIFALWATHSSWCEAQTQSQLWWFQLRSLHLTQESRACSKPRQTLTPAPLLDALKFIFQADILTGTPTSAGCISSSFN